MVTSAGELGAPRFWRDEKLPFIEARSVHDGRKFRYGKHAHEAFSIGIVTSGRCIYLNGKTRTPVGAGSVVVRDIRDPGTFTGNPARQFR